MERKTILIVDDYAGARYLRSRILSEAGYETLEAGHGEEGLRVAAERLPDLILLDINLPDISGNEVCRRLKENPATAGIRVIQITGAWMSDQNRKDGMASGADAYLTEPVDDITLLRNVVNILEGVS
jgi:CheY-like chemotaxis protein